MMEQTANKSIELQNILKILRAYIPKLKEQYKIQQLGVFGSYVRGEENENSDVDILVEFRSDIEFGLITFCQLENQLSEILGKKVNLVTKDGLKPNLGDNILQDVIYL